MQVAEVRPHHVPVSLLGDDVEGDQVDKVIAAGRMAVRATPEFNGFLASLDGNAVETRIEAGIVSGGRRVLPVGN